MAGIFEKASSAWRGASTAACLVTVNIAVFIVMHIGGLLCDAFGLNQAGWLGLWAMPADLHLLAYRPWTPFIYMFAHYDVLHLLFNMLWLYGFARLFLMFSGSRQLMALYIYCGLAGAAMFIAGSYLFDASTVSAASLLGCSASVMGIITGSAAVYPDMPVRMILIGDVKMKWIAVASLALFVLFSYTGNPGGQLAHIGGALMGLYYGLAMRRGVDITSGFNSAVNFLSGIFRPKRKPGRMPSFKKYRRKRNDNKKSAQGTATPSREEFTKADQDELDAILMKVKQSGYTGLTADEKRRLFEVSKRIR